ncbi:dTDP-4-amino-4,6-dideoxygalactose transaminase [Mesoflavibacter sabulilitoris]|uniref:Pyridoxal phosphate-dependent aminotransferase n=1 Tax=Mesoflavibacter zeaxanthinifaciens subsp. sabulilitoris TaxID=1520893 RepID=A0A2T1N6K4_9FLAO|nr:aminotransferase class I/II-fold pyridoxal phosphate-dependent enzyme [Mesoflavibacter zeaxanthinifaciens]MBB3123187.1 dTDP-4-amino-4,6-dideoxygalactose transaminase [Mesoflavibacter zeaxanthinifaciens subsp. sabulilitoris]PSG87174.1 pyridoxal phosphate-dependent aminotransferase [Mesoflavibacter zeaxanthinifaciens subsp. sabulilitoris]
MKPKIWLSSPHMGGTEQNYVQEAFDTNWIAPLGPNVTGFENDLENYLNNDKHVACLSSGTAAIHLALLQLGVKRDDEVICQTFTFCGSANPITYLGAKPIFVDSEEQTWNMCPNYLEEAIKDRIAKGKTPKAIIIVHLYGMPSQIDQLLEVANKYKISIIEDAAEALGSTYKGKKCGTFGAYSILSFNGNKIITTSGGGALVCNTEQEKKQTIFFATQARDNAPHYEHTKIGYNYRMSNISAGIGRGQMEVLDKHINLRRANNQFYNDLFKDVKGIEVQQQPTQDYYSNFWLSCILIHDDAPFTKAQFQAAMDAENIETRPLWKPMHLQPVFKGLPYYGSNVSETLFNKGVCLPSGSNLTKNELDRIKNVVNSLLAKG